MNELSALHPIAIILNPNLGHPLFLSIDKKLNKREFETKILCASNVSDIQEIKHKFKDHIELVPLFESKWKLRQLIEEEKIKREQKIKQSKKEQGIWRRIVFKISKKRRTSFEETIGTEHKRTIEQYENELKEGRENAIRGDPIKTALISIKPASITGIDKPDFNSYHIEEVQDTKFALHCYLVEYKNGIRVECHYFRELFRTGTIEKIMQIYTRILENISGSPVRKIKELSKKIAS